MSRYDRQIASADKMILKYADGQTCTLSYPGEKVGGTEFNPEYSAPVDLPGVPVVVFPISASVNLQFGFNQDSMIPEATTLIYVAGKRTLQNRELTKSCKVTIGQDTYGILGADVIAPSGAYILWQIQVKQ